MMALDVRLREIGETAGWSVEAERRDADGNVVMTFRRGQERVRATVFFDPIRPRSTGRLVWADDEHSTLVGTSVVTARLETESCTFCRSTRKPLTFDTGRR